MVFCFVLFAVFLQKDQGLAFELLIFFPIAVADIANQSELFATKGEVGLGEGVYTFCVLS